MKALKTTLYIITAIVGYIVMTLDRFIMSPFVGIELPSIHFDKGIPRPTDETPEDLKQDLKKERDLARKEFIKGYISKATKRVLITIATILTYNLITWIV